MGVNWQNNDYYQGLKDYEKKTGFTLAEQNAINNPYGSHSFGGLLISKLLPQLIFGVGEKLGGGLNGTMPEDEGIDVQQSSSAIKEFTKVKKNYDRASGEDKIKYAKELQKLGEANPDNPTISKIYNTTFKNELNGIINKK